MENKKFEPKQYVAPPEDRFEQKYSSKSRITAGILALFLGGMGIHDFYLGNTKKGIIHLLLLMTGILSLASTGWAIAEGIMLLCGKINTDAEGNILLWGDMYEYRIIK